MSTWTSRRKRARKAVTNDPLLESAPPARRERLEQELVDTAMMHAEEQDHILDTPDAQDPNDAIVEDMLNAEEEAIQIAMEQQRAMEIAEADPPPTPAPSPSAEPAGTSAFHGEIPMIERTMQDVPVQGQLFHGYRPPIMTRQDRIHGNMATATDRLERMTKGERPLRAYQRNLNPRQQNVTMTKDRMRFLLKLVRQRYFLYSGIKTLEMQMRLLGAEVGRTTLSACYTKPFSVMAYPTQEEMNMLQYLNKRWNGNTDGITGMPIQMR